MATKIRLARGGAKKNPFYRIVVADSREKRDGKFIEKLGTFNPLLSKDNPERFKYNVERMKYWLSTGAKPSDRVSRFLETAGLVAKIDRTKLPKKPKKKEAKEAAAAPAAA